LGGRSRRGSWSTPPASSIARWPPRAGLGWYGKHSCLIVPGHGSWVLLGELVLDLELEPDAPLERDCGRCAICLDKCPTGAIVGPYTVDAPRCLSFQTIEQRGAIPREIRPLLGDWVYGCDVCQEVCPYTGAAREPADPAFAPRSLANAYPSLAWLLRMTEAEFRETYRGTPVLRAKRRGLARNAAVALGNVGTEADVPVLAEALAGHDEPLVRGHAAWALGRLGGREARPALERARRLDPDEGSSRSRPRRRWARPTRDAPRVSCRGRSGGSAAEPGDRSSG
jgi:epoxyqueuosine reductase